MHNFILCHALQSLHPFSCCCFSSSSSHWDERIYSSASTLIKMQGLWVDGGWISLSAAREWFAWRFGRSSPPTTAVCSLIYESNIGISCDAAFKPCQRDVAAYQNSRLNYKNFISSSCAFYIFLLWALRRRFFLSNECDPNEWERFSCLQRN